MKHTIVPQMLVLQRRWEMAMLKAYKDNDGTYHIGFGHGNSNSIPPFVDKNTTLASVDEAIEIQMRDLNEVYAPQLETMLEKDGIDVTDFQFSALLDVLYNRGSGRLLGSYCWHMMKQTAEKNFMAQACRAIVFSGVDGFIPLDVAKDKITGVERVHLGLTLRRIDDASLSQHKE